MLARDLMQRNVKTVSPDADRPGSGRNFGAGRLHRPAGGGRGRAAGGHRHRGGPAGAGQNAEELPTVFPFLGGVIFLESPRKFEEQLRKATGTKVSEIMTRDVVTVTEDTPLARAGRHHGREEGEAPARGGRWPAGGHRHPGRPHPGHPFAGSKRGCLVMHGHVRWVEIDHRALAHNVKALKAHVGPAQLWPVVKGRAYGHGEAEAARTFLQAGADGTRGERPRGSGGSPRGGHRRAAVRHEPRGAVAGGDVRGAAHHGQRARIWRRRGRCPRRRRHERPARGGAASRCPCTSRWTRDWAASGSCPRTRFLRKGTAAPAGGAGGRRVHPFRQRGRGRQQFRPGAAGAVQRRSVRLGRSGAAAAAGARGQQPGHAGRSRGPLGHGAHRPGGIRAVPVAVGPAGRGSRGRGLRPAMSLKAKVVSVRRLRPVRPSATAARTGRSGRPPSSPCPWATPTASAACCRASWKC